MTCVDRTKRAKPDPELVGLAAAAGMDWASAVETAAERCLLVAPEKPRDHVQPTCGHSQFCDNYRRFAR